MIVMTIMLMIIMIIIKLNIPFKITFTASSDHSNLKMMMLIDFAQTVFDFNFKVTSCNSLSVLAYIEGTTLWYVKEL